MLRELRFSVFLAVLALCSGCACGEAGTAECTDGADNDDDGLIDCADPGCSMVPCGGTDAGPLPVCGNGIVNAGEECDGAELGGATCAALGYATGTLVCSSECELDRTDCSTCGDGVAQGGEDCDGSDLRGANCVSLGFTEGIIGCLTECALDLGRCALCGNGTVEPLEACDDGNADETDGCTSACELSCFPTDWTRATTSWVMDVGPPGSWDGAGVVPGSILRDAAGTYRMWYAGFDGGTWRIGVADSPDGVTWTRVAMVLEPDPPPQWDDVNVLDPSVLFDGAMYHLWYTGQDGLDDRIGYAISADGLSWVRQGVLVGVGSGSNGALASEPTVVFGGPRFWQWWRATASLLGGLGSTDGLYWTYLAGPWGSLSSVSADFAYMSHPAAVRIGLDGFALAYAGRCDPAEPACSPVSRIASAALYGPEFSVFWQEALMLDVGPGGSWDEASVSYPSLLPGADAWRLWYGGSDGTTWRIGLATGSCP